MDKSALVSAILSGKKADLVTVLPKVTIISHSEVTKAYYWLCDNHMPPGSAYYREARLQRSDLPKALQAFDLFFANSKSRRTGENISPFHGMDKQSKDLWLRLYDFIKNYYNEYIEPGRINIGYKLNGGVIRYKAYYLTNETV